MIVTIILLPSIEYIYNIDGLKVNTPTISDGGSLSILSEGVYGAQIMRVLQDETILLGITGGFTGKYIKYYLDKSKIKSDLVWSTYETPHRIKILEKATKNYYLLENNKDKALEKELVKLTQKLKEYMSKLTTLVLSGDLKDKDSLVKL